MTKMIPQVSRLSVTLRQEEEFGKRGAQGNPKLKVFIGLWHVEEPIAYYLQAKLGHFKVIFI